MGNRYGDPDDDERVPATSRRPDAERLRQIELRDALASLRGRLSSGDTDVERSTGPETTDDPPGDSDPEGGQTGPGDAGDARAGTVTRGSRVVGPREPRETGRYDGRTIDRDDVDRAIDAVPVRGDDAIERWAEPFERLLGRTVDPGVAMTMADRIEGVYDEVPGGSERDPRAAVRSADDGIQVILSEDAATGSGLDEVFDHEFAHVFAAAQGARYANPTAPYRRANEFADGSGPTSSEEFPAADETTVSACTYVVERDGGPIDPREIDDPTPEERLLGAYNGAFERLHEAHDGGENPQRYVPKPLHPTHGYAGTNVGEFAAHFNEVCQGSAAAEEPATWFFEHGDLTRAYLAVFEPSPEFKTVANYLHDRVPEDSPFDGTPFPDAGVDDGVARYWETNMELYAPNARGRAGVDIDRRGR
ncbi:hypothetical protein BRD17_09055 [Halobacteriales archaeon SW_7_68_16]|nr:MAG: hypothetical protein BRD17_09055 [Halobacteriales archaeon SW_7_68_16]